MKLRNVKLFMALLASLLVLGEQSVLASGVLQSESIASVVEVLGQKVSYFRVEALSAADKVVKLSVNDLSFLKINRKKAEAQKFLSSAQNVLLPEIKSIVSAKKSASMRVIAPFEHDSFVIKFSFDQNGVMTYAVYGTESECPEWLSKTVVLSIAAAQKTGFSWFTKAGIAAGAIAVIARCASYLNNVISSDSIVSSDFLGSKGGAETSQRHPAQRVGLASAGDPSDSLGEKRELLSRLAVFACAQPALLQVQFGDGEVAEADSAVRPAHRRSDASAAPVGLTRTFRPRFDQLVVDVKSFESDVLGLNRISDADLLRQLHLDQTAYPVRSFPEQQVFKKMSLFNAAQPFHKIIDGLYLGNNELTMQLKDKGRVDLTQFKNVTYLNAETFENEVKPNNENMDKPPTLIICVDKNDLLYSSIRGTDAIEFIYFPLDEKEGDDFNNEFIPKREALFARIIDHLSRKDGRVLIHCAQGNHRSVAVLHCFLFETLKQFDNQTDLYSINQFIKSKRSLAMGFAELADKEYKNHGNPCMPSASSMLYQTLLHCCGSVSGARK